ncbi:hypothetical protein ACN9MH_15295 [Paenibacillus silvae]|uniref:hypothetical protein n=1 Tax=Paenibacillus silvae TaxID=1325358 RepID=UPI003CED8DB1
MKKKYIAIIASVIFLVWAGSGWAINTWINASYRGTFGDMFGAVNALFSGFAFAGLIYTIGVQRQELKSQNKSIDMQTDEMKIQVSAIKMQTEELALQREAIQMQTEELALQRKAIEMQTLETARSADQLEGQKNLSNLQTAMSVVNDLIRTKNKRMEGITVSAGSGWIKGTDAFGHLSEVGLGVWVNERTLESYLNLFYYILTFINEYDLKEEQKKLLRDLLNVDTSNEELKVIYRALGNDQHRMGLFTSSGFLTRYKKIK